MREQRCAECIYYRGSFGELSASGSCRRKAPSIYAGKESMHGGPLVIWPPVRYDD